MKTPEEIISWYEEWTPDQGIDPVLEARQYLGVALTRLAKQIAELEMEHAQKDIARKVGYAEQFLEADGNGTEKKERATIKNQEKALEAATLSGRISGAKYYFKSLEGIDKSLASWINRERG